MSIVMRKTETKVGKNSAGMMSGMVTQVDVTDYSGCRIRNVTKDEADHMRELALAGYSHSDIARMMGRNINTVTRHIGPACVFQNPAMRNDPVPVQNKPKTVIGKHPKQNKIFDQTDHHMNVMVAEELVRICQSVDRISSIVQKLVL